MATFLHLQKIFSCLIQGKRIIINWNDFEIKISFQEAFI